MQTQTTNIKQNKGRQSLYRITVLDYTGVRVRFTDNCSFISIFDRSYFEAAGPNCFNGFCKILLKSIFLARIISWSPERAQKQ